MRRLLVSALLAVCVTLWACPASAREGSSLCCDNTAVHFRERQPTETVQKRLAAGTDYLDKFGVTRSKVVAELSAHENDNFYWDTPFVGGDWQSPRGDTSYNGAPGTNCAGFVGYVLRKCGMDARKALEVMRSSPTFTRWGSELPYDGLSSASNYMALAEKGKIISYAYPSKKALLAGGKAEKGDLILRFWTDCWGGYDEDNHLMIFWGNTSSEDKVWQNASGRLHIGEMWDEDDSSFVLIKFAPSAPRVAGFDDVYETHWFAPSVEYVKDSGLMNGTASNLFSPDAPTTRGQFVTILWNLAGQPQVNTNPDYLDVDPKQYYSNAISWAVEVGIVTGYGMGRFGPDDRVTRQDMAVILYQFCRQQGDNFFGWTELSVFTDAEKISEYAVEALHWACGAGLINGTAAGELLPQESASRCQTAAILQNLCEKRGEGGL